MLLLYLSPLAFEQVDTAMRFHHLPVRVGRIRNLEVVGQGQNIIVPILGVGHRTRVRFWALARPAAVTVGRISAGREKQPTNNADAANRFDRISRTRCITRSS